MKTFDDIFDHKICDNCHNYSDSLIQSMEQEWLCPVCEEKHTCKECGDITDEVPMSVDGLCFDCLKLTREDFDLEPVAKLMGDAINKLNQINSIRC